MPWCDHGQGEDAMSSSAGVMVGELPDGITLAPQERVFRSGSFAFSTLLFFLHWRMAVTNKRLVGRTPNTILGVIPLGATQVSYPLSNIAGVQMRTSYSGLWLILGILFLLAGIGGGSIVLVILGALAIIGSLNADIAVTNSGGGVIRHRVAFFNRGAASDFAQSVNEAIATHAGPTTPVAQQPVEQARGTNASDALAELARLRDAGPVTNDEYEAKRQEILRRL